MSIGLERGIVQLQTILFRDHLRLHAQARNEYAQLKQALAAKYSHNREAYTRAKHDFIQQVVRISARQQLSDGAI